MHIRKKETASKKNPFFWIKAKKLLAPFASAAAANLELVIGGSIMLGPSELVLNPEYFDQAHSNRRITVTTYLNDNSNRLPLLTRVPIHESTT